MTWLSVIPAVEWTEQFMLVYSPVWMLTVAAVVVFHLYELFTADTYVLFGARLARMLCQCSVCLKRARGIDDVIGS